MKNKFTLATLIFILGGVAVGYVIYVSGKEAYRGRRIEKEIELLREQAKRIEAENDDLKEKISYFDTDEFREKIAKEKLNMKKEDEKVVEIRPVISINGDEIEEPVVSIPITATEIPNYKKWWNQFFRT